MNKKPNFEENFQCAFCQTQPCKSHSLEGALPVCPTREGELQSEARKLYDDPENRLIATTAAKVEARGYGEWTRIEEIMEFSRLAGYKKIGLIFCTGLSEEAKVFSEILTYNGFEPCSVMCKSGSFPKGGLGISEEDTLIKCVEEVMCNPIGQAMAMNEQDVDFVVILGLCVGHDTLTIKHLDAPVTILAVKDRVTGHNPLAALYNAKSYYRKKFFPEKI